MKCAACGAESGNEKFFRTARRTFSSKARSLCPACFRDKDDAILKTIFRSLSGLGLLGLLLIFAFPHLSAGVLLLNIGVVLAAVLVSTMLHELGHAAAGALESVPWNVNFKGTRGIDFVELGKHEEGIALLEEALRSHPEKWGKAINACYLGVAAARRGYTSESRCYFAM